MTKKTFLAKVFPLALLVTLAFFTLGSSSVVAAPNTLHLSVISATDGTPVTNYRYIINIDNTGTTVQRSPEDDNYACSPTLGDGSANPAYPDSCDWVSVAGRAAHSPVFTQGSQNDFPGGVFTINGKVVDMPPGRYLISVLADNFQMDQGYKIDGEHFTIVNDGSDVNVTVKMQPYDLPVATVQAAVFEDMASTNSAPDIPGERGLAGFRAHIVDYVDEVTVDVFGNPLGAEYEKDADGNVLFDADGAPIYIEGTGGVVLSKCYVVANGEDVGTVDPINESLWPGQNWPTEGRCPLGFTPEEDSLLTSPIEFTNEGDPIPVGAVVEGKAIIPNVGPNRYALSVVPPDASNWIQTTTLEGNHDWDAWVMEGATGLDTEFVVAGEPFPATFFGFVRPTFNSMDAGDNTISGRGLAVSAYIPPAGGIVSGEGVLGAKAKDVNPVHRLFVSLSDLNNGDQTVFIQEFPCDEDAGCPVPDFTIPNVPDGDYVLGVWDEPQDYIFAVQNVSVQGGEVANVGDITLLGWWTTFEGYVFHDINGNGFKDEGEPGISNFPIGMRTRENSLMDRGTTGVTTDANGYYWMESAYPMTQWLIMEAYADGFHTTGISYYADNQIDENGDPIWTTIHGAGVDVNVHPVIGLGGRIDWGVQPYAPGENGGIVGTVSYDTTRNELDPSYAAIEDWQPSISDLTVELYAPIACGTHPNTPCDAAGQYELAKDGSYALGNLLNTYLTESWEQPTGCVARDLNGRALEFGTPDQQVLPYDPSNAPDGYQNQDARCMEAPMMGVQFGPLATDQGDPDLANFGASVDGNYGFGDGCFMDDGVTPGLFDPDTGDCVDGQGTIQALPSNTDYLVRVDIPDDEFGRPLYQVTREEDINVANGDSFVPQVPPSICAGALHTVDVMDFGSDGFSTVIGAGYEVNGIAVGVKVPASTPIYNPPFVDMGGTIYEGQQKPLCDMKLIHLADQKSIAPGFNFFTDVPLPGRFWGLIVDDLNWSTNPKQTGYGEKMGIPFVPVGIYDYTNRLITTVESDYNGLFDVLLPSTDRISCPTPSGVCANLYRFVGNDPGTPGHWNATYTPVYRTISAEFEAFAGLTVPADLAPTTVAASVQIPGTQTLTPVACLLEETDPQLLAVDRPYADVSTTDDAFTIEGFGFGATTGSVMLDNSIVLPTTSWNDGTIQVTVPFGTASGEHQLSVVSTNGRKTVNGLTFHVFTSVPGPVPAFPSNMFPLDTFNDPPSYSFSAHWAQNANNAFEAVDQRGTLNDYLRVKAANNSISNAWWTDATFGADQEAYFTFRKISNNPNANHQGLLLKYSNGITPNDTTARWVSVVVDNNNDRDPEGATIKVYTKASGSDPVLQLEIETPNLFFQNSDQIGARAYHDGTIIVYKNGSEIGTVNVPETGAWTGRIGLRFEGTGTSNGLAANIDNFGGGDSAFPAPISDAPVLFEVGPGHPYSNIQSAIDAAAAQSPYQDSLVVVYPASPDNTNPRYNGRGAYYENPIMYAPVQLQGVGPGGVRPDGSIVYGTIIDGIAFGGDTTLALNWLGKVTQLQYEPELNPNGGWDGNQDINDGQVIYVLASAAGDPTQTRAGSFPNDQSPDFKPMIDGFDIRGGDQQGLPGNLPEIFGQPPDTIGPVQVETQGGAIFVNAYANDLQITNNFIQQNGGSYGAIRIGTPNLTGPDADNNNDNLRIANNRILANGGTNLAGAIGLFNGADNYEVANNDLCGNFSAEYGGAISHFGFSNGGQIHDNRIYFNRSYDEGAGIMIAGELPLDPNALYGTPGGPQGTGAVDIYNNLIEANIAEDDGGGIRFLMAGNFEMNVFNNMLVNNISTHEGGGIALDDAPNVRFYNNTVMSNITTATAITSDGTPAPAGLSTGPNSDALQPTLPGGSPFFSNPLLFNNIFWNNRAGTRDDASGMVLGIGAEGDATPINYWDLGLFDSPYQVSPSNSVIQQNTGTYPYIDGGMIATSDPTVVSTLDIPLYFTSWRAFFNTILVTIDLPPSLIGDYHLSSTSSPAYDTGADNKTVPGYQAPPLTLDAPTYDIDNEGRPAGDGIDMGADEFGGVPVLAPGLASEPSISHPTQPTLPITLKQIGTYTPGAWIAYFEAIDKDLKTLAGALP